MDIRQLRYLIAIAEERHVGRAADRLHVSQPALSQQLRKLEEEVGAALFERHARGMRLTPQGEVLVRYAMGIVQQVREAREQIDSLNGRSQGYVTVGVVQSVNGHLMPSVVAQMVADCPGVRISLCELSGGQIEDGVAEGNLDVGVGFVPPRRDDLEFEPLFAEELKLIVRQEHEFARMGEIDVRLLNELPMALLGERFVARQLLETALQQAGAIPKVMVETNTIAALVEVAVRTGLPIVLPVLAVSGGPGAQLLKISLRNPCPRRSVGLLWRSGGVRSAASDALVERLRAAVRDTPGLGASQGRRH